MLDDKNTAHIANVFRAIRDAAKDTTRVAGLTHCHYKYPARFSPQFVSAAISTLSKPGDVILDPYMGGGTTIVEAMSNNRRAIGCDLNSLAVFIAKVKTSNLSRLDEAAILHWALDTVPTFNYRTYALNIDDVICKERTRNLDVPRARAIKKFIALALLSLRDLPTPTAEKFARCVLLNVSQWALNGRKRQVSLPEFRQKVSMTTIQMLEAAAQYKRGLGMFPCRTRAPVFIHGSSENIAVHGCWRDGTLADLVVTSPPYPGVHVLYHRWQVDGRKETPAPYWIANQLDGHCTDYYNFGNRQQENHDDYFAASLRTLKGIRSVMKDNATIVQMVAFSEPRNQLPRYLANMAEAGFKEIRSDAQQFHRISRIVPGRSWHAQLQGRTHSAREIVLLHTATK